MAIQMALDRRENILVVLIFCMIMHNFTHVQIFLVQNLTGELWAVKGAPIGVPIKIGNIVKSSKILIYYLFFLQ